MLNITVSLFSFSLSPYSGLVNIPAVEVSIEWLSGWLIDSLIDWLCSQNNVKLQVQARSQIEAMSLIEAGSPIQAGYQLARHATGGDIISSKSAV